MYITVINRDSKNQSNGRPQYRVAVCVKKWFDGAFSKKGGKVTVGSKSFVIETNKPYRVGNLINPRKALGI